jgi:DNA invertase Pin-like site-specific DNA recombinase
VIQENVNTRSPMGRFVFILFSAVAQLEREQIAERTSSAMLRLQAKGRRMTRPDRCPYGWRPDPSDAAGLIEDADEQATIRRIREERRIGRGLREIARRLDAAGIACRGGRWSHTTVRSVLLRAAQFAEDT